MMTAVHPPLMHSTALRGDKLERSSQEGLAEFCVSEQVHERSPVFDSEKKDSELVQALRQGNDVAFKLLVDRYHARLHRLAQTYVRSEAVAEEVVQDTWLAVLEGIHRFEGRSSLKTWIFQILTNQAKTRGVRESRYVSFSSASTTVHHEEDHAIEPELFHAAGALSGTWTVTPGIWEEHTPERVLLSREGLDHIHKAIHALPANLRQVIILRDIEGIDPEGICELLEITATNQRVLLHRARTKVRKALEHYLNDSSTQQ
ncbi:MAG: sigma-70 family RNA polymerase sigma factor [Nitrospirales bacterium]|nr:sigma-70 family RNA polymerase sigma factor [Nitrospira sp.]MDR4501997.1 sigma-70 family RNA polymerase sigma factor [Nitrospirales bacterium]